jgi:hypothetical protein
MPNVEKEEKLSNKGRILLVLKKIGEFLLILFGIFWLIVQMVSTFAWDFSVFLFEKISGVSSNVVFAEQGNYIGDQIFTANYYYVFMFIAIVVSIIGMIVLTKRRSILTGLALIVAFMLPREQESWGTVRDKETGQPLPFAIIRIIKKETSPEQFVVQETVADLDGKYRIVLAELNPDYRISVSAPSFITTVDKISFIDASGESTINVIQDVTLARSTDEATVNKFTFLRPKLYSFLIWVVYIFCVLMLLQSIAYIFFYPDSWYGYIMTVIYTVGTIWNTWIMLSRYKKKNGKVIDADTNEPLSGVFVNIYNLESKSLLDSKLTGKDGLVRLHVRGGKYLLSAAKSGFAIEDASVKEGLLEVKVNELGFLNSNIAMKSHGTSNNSGLSSPFAS